MAVPHLTLVGEGAFGPERDASVVRALQRGEAGAPFAAWARLRPQVDRTLRRLMGPDTEIEDLSQEVFLSFFSSVPRLRDPEALRSFLFGICLRVTRRERRSRWLRRLLRLTTDGQLPEGAAAPGPDAEVREVLRRYYRVLDRLGAEARSMFIARTIDGLPLHEVAALHGVSVSTAQRRLARATRRVGVLVAGDPVLLSYVRAQAGDGEEPA
ncbi:MAG TPA: sigma-70 family RNA polymerase sigma factor [Polyangia bacterium]|nr:sigma-70 family RNA polymerase sigma factor [Polyangia bacterium]